MPQELRLWMVNPRAITVAQEFIYPTEYEPAPPPTIGGGGGNNDGGGLGGAIQIQSAMPPNLKRSLL